MSVVELNELFDSSDKALLNTIKQKTDISTVLDFAVNTNERKERSTLAQILNCPKHTLYYYAKLADLLQCAQMTVEEAKFLVQTGVRCANDIFYLNTEKYLSYVSEYGYKLKNKAVDEALVSRWIDAATALPSRLFECDETDAQNQRYTYFDTQKQTRKPSTSMGVDLRDIISELGAGLAEAQKALDMNSIAVQKEILADPDLRGYGLNATWYTIPETTFSLKMTYHFSEETEKTVSGAPKLKMKIVPSNATYNNTYKTSGEQESTVSLRFVPIPPPEGMTDRIQMPDLIGQSVDVAIAALQELGLEYELVRVKGEPKNGSHTEVLRQSLSSGATITDLSLLDIAPDTYVMAHTRITLTYLDDESGADPTESALKAILDEVNQAAETAKLSASAAETSAQSAESSASAAKTAAKNAESSASAAKNSAKSAETSAAAAKKSASGAEASAKSVETNTDTAKKSSDTAKKSADAAQKSAAAAAQSASEASGCVTGAVNSAGNASLSQKEANLAASSAKNSAAAAETAAKEASSSAEEARQSAVDAASAAVKAGVLAQKTTADESAVSERKNQSANAKAEKKTYGILLKSCENKVTTTKIVKQLMGCDLKNAKEKYVDQMPVMLKEGMEKEEALEWMNQLKEASAVVELIEV